MITFNNISNTELSRIIDDFIKNQRDRLIMKRRLLDGICYEALAEEFELSSKQIYRIVNKYITDIHALCNEWIAISI
jgi:Mor family transcriptional regulator